MITHHPVQSVVAVPPTDWFDFFLNQGKFFAIPRTNLSRSTMAISFCRWDQVSCLVFAGIEFEREQML
jgi:hypothetical protein